VLCDAKKYRIVMEKGKQYVLGFAFSENREHLVLIEKQTPEWQKGKLNGVGGKIDPEDQSPDAAMIREFMEETGVATSMGGPDGWYQFATMTFQEDVMGGLATVYCYRMFSNVAYKCKTVEKELIVTINSGDYNLFPIIDNLPVLIPMALHQSIKFCELNY
jgi:8-oxo-dGTP diphosphatase